MRLRAPSRGRGEDAHAPARSRVRSQSRLASRSPLTSQDTAHGRFTRAIKQRNLFAPEMAYARWATRPLPDLEDETARIKTCAGENAVPT
jgi:hypothetical protein